MNNRVSAIALGLVAAAFALWLGMRIFLMSEYGLSGSWMFFGLPFGGIGILVLLFRLGVFGSGPRSNVISSPWPQPIGTQAPWQQPTGTQAPAAMPAAQGLAVTHRLHELEGLRSSGAISEAEYAAKRQAILANM